MGVSGATRRLAAGAPVPVFAVVGRGAREAVQDLSLRTEVRLTDSPRTADVLLLAGDLPPGLIPPATVAHDAMSHPRCTVWWPLDARRDMDLGWPSLVVAPDPDVVPLLVSVHRDLVLGRRPSDPPLLPNVDPAPWRGVGPYGQGGLGMTGGVPYGRPMAERADDRDGLSLDQLHVRIGPLLAAFPPGLTLDLKLQGDVIQEAIPEDNPYAAGRGVGGPPRSLRPFLRALREPVPIPELELARARSHLRWAAWGLHVHGLPALGARVLQLALRVEPGDAEAIQEVIGALRRSRILGWATTGVGVMSAHDLAGLGVGPVARAAGLPEDLRSEDQVYRALGFEPIVHDDGDARARWRQRLAEAAQALVLAERGAGRTSTPMGSVEAPRGRLGAGTAATAASTHLLPMLPGLLQGLEWGDAVATLVSLDLDLEEAAVSEEATAAEVRP